MLEDHHFEKANFQSLIEEDNIGRVNERLNIIDTFLGTERHLTLEELMGLLKERGYDYDPDFVRQCMNRWVEYGFAQKKMFEGQPSRYEHRHLGRHHDHLICTKCGNVTEFQNDEIERLQAQIAALHGFHLLQHKMEIYGLCRKCLEQRRPVMPLALAGAGERVIVTDMRAGKMARSKLNSMGLRVGDLIEVINNDGQGRLVIGRESTRLAIGRGLAAKIMVSFDHND
jgi:Fur family ferric uptake transcriptional regulator